MIERTLFEILESGVDTLKNTPGLVTEILTADGILEKEEAEKVEALFIKEPPSVVHGYARVDNKFPLYAITLGGESQGQAFLGDEGGMDDDPESESYGEDEYATIFTYTFNLMVYAQHPDVVLYLYQILKNILIAGYPSLKGDPLCLFDLRFGGADMAPDPAWVPAGLFVRRATLSCSRQYTQGLVPTKLGKAWKTQGMHIDALGAVGQDVGGVATQVYPVDEEGEA